MTAIGIDLGGTKIETQVFDANWAVLRRNRVDTPAGYQGLVRAMADQIAWAEAPDAPVGIAAAGLIDPRTGFAYTANLPATGKPFPDDIAQAAGRTVTYVNDCRALTLSEAIFGAAKGRNPVMGLILGTGIGGGVAVGGDLLEGAAHVGGEFGHTAAPAHLVVKHGLPVVQCGCGRMGCFETYIAGPGLTQLSEHFIGRRIAPKELAKLRGTDPKVDTTLAVWADFVAELLLTLTLVVDPECVVLGGGLSLMEGVVPDLQQALQKAQLPGFDVPQIMLAQGGDSSGARGAGYAAWRKQEGSKDA